MKKSLVLSVFLSVSSFSAMAQDDVYFRPERKPVEMVYEYASCDRDVDEYNRCGYFGYRVIPPLELDSLACDTIEFHCGIDSLPLRPDFFITPGYADDFRYSRNVDYLDDMYLWNWGTSSHLNRLWGSELDYFTGSGDFPTWYAPNKLVGFCPIHGVVHALYLSPDYRPEKKRFLTHTDRWIRDNRKASFARSGRYSGGYSGKGNPGDRSSRVSRRRSEEGVSGRSSRSSRRGSSSSSSSSGSTRSYGSSYGGTSSYSGGSSFSGGGGSYGGGGSRGGGGFSHGGRR